MLSDLQIRSYRTAGVLAMPGLFVFDEIGWLREEAIAAALRHGVASAAFDPNAAAIVKDPHRREPAFRKLARHPRLVGPARALLGGAIAIGGTYLFIGNGNDFSAMTDAGLGAVVFLDRGADAAPSGHGRLGSVLFVDARARDRCSSHLVDAMLTFVVRFVRAAEATACGASGALSLAIEPEADDCLWPTPFVAFG